MKMKYFLTVLIFLITFTNTVRADYWSYGNTVYSTNEISDELYRQLDDKIAQSTGLNKVVYDTVGRFTVPIVTFFYMLNTWIGETIFLVRLLFWFLLAFLVQYVVLGLINKVIRIVIKIIMLVMFIMNSNDILDSIEETESVVSKFKKNLTKSSKKTVKSYKKLRHILKELT